MFEFNQACCNPYNTHCRGYERICDVFAYCAERGGKNKGNDSNEKGEFEVRQNCEKGEYSTGKCKVEVLLAFCQNYEYQPRGNVHDAYSYLCKPEGLDIA